MCSRCVDHPECSCQIECPIACATGPAIGIMKCLGCGHDLQ